MTEMKKISQQPKLSEVEHSTANTVGRGPHSFSTTTRYRGIDFDRLCLVAQEAIQEGRVFEREVLGTRRSGYNHFNPDGSIGGFVELSARIPYSVIVEAGAMVLDYARVFVYARIAGSSIVSGNAKVYGNAIVDGNSMVTDNAEVCVDARVTNSKITGDSIICGNAQIRDTEVHNKKISSGVMKK